jgi:protein-S-isoprenylcysteine O-methyltransferase Ste14
MKRLEAVTLQSGIPDMARFETPSVPRPVPAGDAAPGQSLGLGDIVARVVIVALFTFMAVRLGSDFLHSGRTTGLLLLASEGLVVILTVFRRPAGAVDRSLRARILMVVSLMGPVLVTPSSIPALLPEFSTVAVSACGLLVVIIGKLSLGRSFGLMPANRGVVSTGLYRVVRHPIYMGYLVTHAAFCAANPTLANVMILVAADIALLIRAVCEEQTLAKDAAYRDYQQLVRWRVLPGVF